MLCLDFKNSFKKPNQNEFCHSLQNAINSSIFFSRGPGIYLPKEYKNYLSEPSLSTTVWEMLILLETSVLLGETFGKPLPPARICM